MRPYQRLALFTFCLLLTWTASVAWGAATVTFTPDEIGTFPGTFQFDRETQVLTVDLAALPADATIFRAELILKPRGQFDKPITKPTTVYPVDRPEDKLAFVAPRLVGLDALKAVQAAVRAGRPLELKLETTLRGVERLEVSYLEGKSRTKLPAASGINVRHRNGQSLITFGEPKLDAIPDFKTGADCVAFKKQLAEKHPGLQFRIWRSDRRITPSPLPRRSWSASAAC